MNTNIELTINEAAQAGGRSDPAAVATAPHQTRQSLQKLSYTVTEAVAALSIGKTTLYKLIGEGRLKVVKIGARTLIPASELEALVVPSVG